VRSTIAPETMVAATAANMSWNSSLASIGTRAAARALNGLPLPNQPPVPNSGLPSPNMIANPTA
jgi:hypothetical protein